MKLSFIQGIHVASTLLPCLAPCPGTARDLTPCMLLVLVVTCQSSATFKTVTDAELQTEIYGTTFLLNAMKKWPWGETHFSTVQYPLIEHDGAEDEMNDARCDSSG